MSDGIIIGQNGIFPDEPPQPSTRKRKRGAAKSNSLAKRKAAQAEKAAIKAYTEATPARMAELEAELDKHISPAGALKIAELRSELLEKERLEKRLPDELFLQQPFNDRILVYRFSENQGKTFVPGGVIEMPDTVKEKKQNQVPRGILIAAGLGALDTLRSNGIDLGHTITLLRNVPWRIVCCDISGVEFALLVLRDGDVIGSETLQENLASGEVKIAQHVTEDGAIQHIYVDKDGKNWIPRPAWVSDDM